MSTTASMSNRSATQTVALTQPVLDQCYLPYDPDAAPTLYDLRITTTNAPPRTLSGASSQSILLPGPLMDRACLLLARGFDTARTAEKLSIYAFCSPEPDDSLAVDAAAVYSAHALKADLVVLNAEDLADEGFRVLGEELSSALWALYTLGIQSEPDADRAVASETSTEDGDNSTASETGPCARKMPASEIAGPRGEAYRDAFACAVGFLKALIGQRAPNTPAKRRRLLYLRNFAAMSYAFHPLIDALSSALAACEMPILVVAGIWQAQRPGDDETIIKPNWAEAFRSDSALSSYIRTKYAPGKHRLRDTQDRFTSLSDLFQAALMQHSGARRFQRGFPPFAQSSHTEFVFERALPIILEHRAPPISVETGATAFRRDLIVQWNVQQLGVALINAGVKVVKSSLNVSNWVAYCGHPDTGPPIRHFTSQIIPSSVLDALVANMQDGLGSSPSYADILTSIQRSEAASAALISRIDTLQSKSSQSEAVKAAIRELRNTGRVDSDQADILSSLVVEPRAIETRYEDVHIQPHIIESIRSAISLPLKYQVSGIVGSESVGGFLLYGPPGTGKTMLCRALARESGLRFLQLRYGDVQSRYVSVAEKFVHAIFDFARRIGPCILFIDELDALFARRGGRTYPYWAQTLLVEFMQEMDGLTTSAANKASNLIIIGATNRPQDVDDAVLRRLPNRFLVDLPGKPEREKIIRHYLRQEQTDATVNIEMLAKRTKYYSGSDLKHVVLHAAQRALRDAIQADAQVGSDVPSQPAGLLTPNVVISAHHFDSALRRISASCRTNMPALRRVQRFGRSEEKPSVFARVKSLLQRRQAVPQIIVVSAPGPRQRG